MKKTGIIIVCSTVGVMTMIGAGAVMVWNSRQARMLRMTRRVGRVMYGVGTMLQGLSVYATGGEMQQA